MKKPDMSPALIDEVKWSALFYLFNKEEREHDVSLAMDLLCGLRHKDNNGLSEIYFLIGGY